MYPTISHLLEDLFGVFVPLPVQTFGFFVAVAFALAAYVLYRELKRKEQEGLMYPTQKTVVQGKPASQQELLLNGLLGFVLGYKLVFLFMNYSAFVEAPQDMVLSLEGNWLGGLLGGGLLGYLKYREKEKQRLQKPMEKEVAIRPYERAGDITILAAISGILGAKVFHNLEYYEDFLAHPVESLLSFSGLTFYGGLIVAAVVLGWYAKKYRIGVAHLADAVAPALMLAYGVGRIGCHLAGDGDWGIVNEMAQPEWLSMLPAWVWAFDYPNNVLMQGIPIPGCEGSYCYHLEQPVFPTPLYESIVCIALFGVLWSVRKRIRIPGMLFSVYLILNGLERFFIEKIRVNATYDFLPFAPTQAELISAVLVLLGTVGAIYCYRNRHNLPKALLAE